MSDHSCCQGHLCLSRLEVMPQFRDIYRSRFRTFLHRLLLQCTYWHLQQSKFAPFSSKPLGQDCWQQVPASDEVQEEPLQCAVAWTVRSLAHSPDAQSLQMRIIGSEEHKIAPDKEANASSRQSTVFVTLDSKCTKMHANAGHQVTGAQDHVNMGCCAGHANYFVCVGFCSEAFQV